MILCPALFPSTSSTWPGLLCPTSQIPTVSLTLLKRSSAAQQPHQLKKDSSNSLAMHTASIMGLLVWICGVLYSSIRSITNSQAARITTTNTVNLTDPEASSVFKGEDGPSGNSESGGVNYSWSLFHLMFALATLYVMMALNDRYAPGRKKRHNRINLCKYVSCMDEDNLFLDVLRNLHVDSDCTNGTSRPWLFYLKLLFH